MFSRSNLRLLSILAIVLTLVQANWLDAHLLRRQDGDSSNGGGILSDIVGGITSALEITSPTDTTTTSIPTSSVSSVIPTSTTSSSTPSSTPSSTSSSTTPTSIPSDSSTLPSSTTPPSSTPSSVDSTSSKDDHTTSKASQSVFTTVIGITTVIDGSTLVSSSTATSSTTSPTSDPSLNGSDSNKSSGISSSTKKTIIGVVVGIGGAIILAGIGVVAWRIWGRRKPDEYENDGLMGSSEIKMTSPSSSGAGAAASPFQSTLDQYHTPRNVNASSNF